MEKQAILNAQVFDLLDDLRLKGFRIGVAQYMAVQKLMLVAKGNGSWPDDPTRWRTLLGPLLCIVDPKNWTTS